MCRSARCQPAQASSCRSTASSSAFVGPGQRACVLHGAGVAGVCCPAPPYLAASHVLCVCQRLLLLLILCVSCSSRCQHRRVPLSQTVRAGRQQQAPRGGGWLLPKLGVLVYGQLLWICRGCTVQYSTVSADRDCWQFRLFYGPSTLRKARGTQQCCVGRCVRLREGVAGRHAPEVAAGRASRWHAQQGGAREGQFVWPA